MRKQVGTFKRGCDIEEGLQEVTSLNFPNLSFCVIGDTEGSRGSQVSGGNFITKVLLWCFFNFSLCCWHSWRWEIFRLFLLGTLGDIYISIYIYPHVIFAPSFKDTVENHSPRAQSNHYPKTVKWNRSICRVGKEMSPIHHDDTAEGQDMKFWFCLLWQHSFSQQISATLHTHWKGNGSISMT